MHYINVHFLICLLLWFLLRPVFYICCFLNKSYFVKVIQTLHKPPRRNGMRVFNRDQTKGQSKPSTSYCNLSAGWHGDASAFNLLEGVVLIILPTNRETQSNINTRPDCGPPESRLHRNIKGGTWQLAQGLWEEAELHYLQICVIKLTSEAQNNRGGEETGLVWQLARDKQSTGTGSHWIGYNPSFPLA